MLFPGSKSVSFRVKFKVLSKTFKALQELTPTIALASLPFTLSLSHCTPAALGPQLFLEHKRSLLPQGFGIYLIISRPQYN